MKWVYKLLACFGLIGSLVMPIHAQGTNQINVVEQEQISTNGILLYELFQHPEQKDAWLNLFQHQTLPDLDIEQSPMAKAKALEGVFLIALSDNGLDYLSQNQGLVSQYIGTKIKDPSLDVQLAIIQSLQQAIKTKETDSYVFNLLKVWDTYVPTLSAFEDPAFQVARLQLMDSLIQYWVKSPEIMGSSISTFLENFKILFETNIKSTQKMPVEASVPYLSLLEHTVTGAARQPELLSVILELLKDNRPAFDQIDEKQQYAMTKVYASAILAMARQPELTSTFENMVFTYGIQVDSKDDEVLKGYGESVGSLLEASARQPELALLLQQKFETFYLPYFVPGQNQSMVDENDHFELTLKTDQKAQADYVIAIYRQNQFFANVTKKVTKEESLSKTFDLPKGTYQIKLFPIGQDVFDQVSSLTLQDPLQTSYFTLDKDLSLTFTLKQGQVSHQERDQYYQQFQESYEQWVKDQYASAQDDKTLKGFLYQDVDQDHQYDATKDILLKNTKIKVYQKQSQYQNDGKFDVFVSEATTNEKGQYVLENLKHYSQLYFYLEGQQNLSVVDEHQGIHLYDFSIEKLENDPIAVIEKAPVYLMDQKPYATANQAQYPISYSEYELRKAINLQTIDPSLIENTGFQQGRGIALGKLLESVARQPELAKTLQNLFEETLSNSALLSDRSAQGYYTSVGKLLESFARQPELKNMLVKVYDQNRPENLIQDATSQGVQAYTQQLGYLLESSARQPELMDSLSQLYSQYQPDQLTLQDFLNTASQSMVALTSASNRQPELSSILLKIWKDKVPLASASKEQKMQILSSLLVEYDTWDQNSNYDNFVHVLFNSITSLFDDLSFNQTERNFEEVQVLRANILRKLPILLDIDDKLDIIASYLEKADEKLELVFGKPIVLQPIQKQVDEGIEFTVSSSYQYLNYTLVIEHQPALKIDQISVNEQEKALEDIFTVKLIDPNGQVVQPKPGTSFTITIPLNEKLIPFAKENALQVFHIHDDQQVNPLEYTFDETNDKIMFTLDQFSTIVIYPIITPVVEEPVQPEAPKPTIPSIIEEPVQPEVSKPNSSSMVVDTSDPSTLGTEWMLFVSMLACVAGVQIIKKKIS